MSHPSYAKGYRFEKKVQAWLVHLGRCIRSMMSRGDDLTLLFANRNWSVSCKCRANKFKFIYDELENADIVALGADRQFPIIAMLAPKFIELVGKAEAQDAEENAA